MPRDGGCVLLEDFKMEPFISEGFLNSNLSVQVPIGPVGSNGFPGGHADLDDGHPSLVENFPEGILVVKVPSAPLRPETVEKKATENI